MKWSAIFCGLLILSLQAYADSETGEQVIVRLPDADHRIQGLSFDQTSFPLIERESTAFRRFRSATVAASDGTGGTSDAPLDPLWGAPAQSAPAAPTPSAPAAPAPAASAPAAPSESGEGLWGAPSGGAPNSPQPEPFAKPDLVPAPTPTAQPNSSATYWVFLKGHYTQHDSTRLRAGDEPITVDPASGAFEIPVQIRAARTTLTIRAVSLFGESQGDETIELEVPRWDEVRASAKTVSVKTDSNTALSPKRIAVQVGIGYSLNSYTSPFSTQYQQSEITPKLTVDLALVPGQWSLTGNALLTALPLGLTAPTQTTIHYLSFDAAVGYRLPFLADPWRLNLLAGFYYTTMSTTPQAIGYRDISGPELFPTLSRVFSNGGVGSVYFKYSPVMSQDLSSYEIAAGANYAFGNNPISIFFDYSSLALPTSLGSASNTSLTFGVGYSF